MPGFPGIDPIPLPAPVALLKLLHILTIALHFAAVQMVIGGLVVATALSAFGRSAEATSAARALGRRLPVVMTYVINLGVPPLLFAQVLYGPALYTSSVLIGAWWIAVIPLLMVCYWLLYQFSARLESGKTAWWTGLLSLAIAGGIAQIYSSNMTLMLRPEVWQSMYAASSAGVSLPSGDPSLGARLSFMISGGLTVGGLSLLWLSGRSEFGFDERRFLAHWGGRLAAVAAVLQTALALRVFLVQPAAVQAGMAGNLWYQGAGYAWLGATALVVVAGVVAAVRRSASVAVAWAAPVLIFLQLGALALYRDGIRDLTLLSKGFDVWNQRVVTNWSVVGLFLALFVAGLGAVGWLMSVVARAKPAAAKAA